MRYSQYKFIIPVALFILFGQVARGEKIADLVNEGNKAFLNKEYSTALDQYQIAEGEDPDSPELNYNIASVLYEQGKYEESIDRFKKSLSSMDPSLQASAHYNLGNSYFRSGDYMKAIQSYQDALGLNPDDMDAKFNLELARKMLKENSKPEKSKDKKKEEEKQKQDENKEDQEKKEDKQEQDKKDQQDKDKKDQKQNQQEQDKKDKQDQDKKDKQQKKMSKEDAERILNALRDDEQKEQAKIRRVRSSGNYTGEDW